MEYEYEIVTLETSGGDVSEEKMLKMMHDLGKEGWEFVSATPLATFALLRQSGTTAKIFFFFKRPKKSKSPKIKE
jgi:hypothetical protein